MSQVRPAGDDPRAPVPQVQAAARAGKRRPAARRVPALRPAHARGRGTL